jgi:hypothetical protein
MPCVRYEPMIPASERAKTVYALDRSATVTGVGYILFGKEAHLSCQICYCKYNVTYYGFA